MALEREVRSGHVPADCQHLLHGEFDAPQEQPDDGFLAVSDGKVAAVDVEVRNLPVCLDSRLEVSIFVISVRSFASAQNSSLQSVVADSATISAPVFIPRETGWVNSLLS